MLDFKKPTGHLFSMPRPANPEVRSRLLTCGSNIVRSQGFNATGVEKITAAARIPKGSFYNYFDSKEAFAAEILDTYWIAVVNRYGLILTQSSFSPVVRIKRYFAGLTEFHEQQDFALGCLVGNMALEVSSASEETRTKLLSIFHEWTTMLADCLRQAQERGDIPANKDCGQLARALIDAFEGAVMRAKVERKGAPLRRFQDLVLPCLLR
jgi:TetR/AcrR family transcriptional repressor of nem operon